MGIGVAYLQVGQGLSLRVRNNRRRDLATGHELVDFGLKTVVNVPGRDDVEKGGAQGGGSAIGTGDDYRGDFSYNLFLRQAVADE